MYNVVYRLSYTKLDSLFQLSMHSPCISREGLNTILTHTTQHNTLTHLLTFHWKWGNVASETEEGGDKCLFRDISENQYDAAFYAESLIDLILYDSTSPPRLQPHNIQLFGLDKT